MPPSSGPVDGKLLVKGGIVDGAPLDVRIGGGRITAVGRALPPSSDEDVLDVKGGMVMPGLHDHHLHLRALVAATRSVAVGPGDVADSLALSHALHGAPVDARGWRRAVGYHGSVAGDLDRWSLDALGPMGPIRLQHRSGAMWVLNSAAIDALGLDDDGPPGAERDASGRATGRLFRSDDWLAAHLSDGDPITDVGAVSRQLAEAGVTGVTDATPNATAPTVAALVEAVADGRLCQRLHVMCAADVDVPPHPLVSRGPHKVMLDDDHLPSVADLVDVVHGAHRGGIPVAFHCVTPAQLVLALTALKDAGSVNGDRIEHGAVVPADVVADLAALGIAVVTNPAFISERGDEYLRDVDPRDLPHLYPCASLLAGGVVVAAGTDAPFGPPDPWTAVSAARTRRTRRGQVVDAGERVSAEAAVGLFTGQADSPGRARRIAVGEPGDLCVLPGPGLPEPGQTVAARATVVAGRVVHRRD